MAWSKVAAAETAVRLQPRAFGRRRCRLIDDVPLNNLVARRVRADGARPTSAANFPLK